jgi:outer membrane lipoprotein carrier protein
LVTFRGVFFPVACLSVAAAVGAFERAAPPATAEEWARSIEARHRKAADLTARFTQTYRSKILGREIVERGTVSIKRPGRMLWEYTDPEKKLFVCDGKNVYFYVPADKQVIKRERAGDQGVALGLLSGEGDVLSQFDASIETTATGQARLRLTPRKADPEVERIFVEADSTHRISAIEVRDAQGNESRFTFDAIRENVGLKDTLFRFVVPKGVEVVTG